MRDKGFDSPPRLPAWLLARLLPPDTAEPILGDFEELYRLRSVRAGARDATRWYWRQTVGLIAARLHWRPLGRPTPVRRNTTMSALIQDLRFALRALRKQAGFTLTAVLTLALGIGGNLAIFALVYAVLLRPLPFHAPDELMLVQLLVPDRDASGVFRPMIWSIPKYQVLRDRQQVFTATALFDGRDWSLTNTASPERLEGEIVEGSYFALLGVDAGLGRLFGRADDRVGAPPVAVISDGLWRRRYGGDPNILGKPLGLDGEMFTIVGVAPRGFRGLLGQADVWRPLATTDPSDLVEPFSHSYRQVARRKPGVTNQQAEAAVRVLGAQVSEAYPRGGAGSATAVPIDEERIDPLLRRAVLVLLGAVSLVLLIACVNLANLSLARGLSRQREVAIRLALGAGRLRIVRQFLTESLVLSCLGTLVGIVVAMASVRLVTLWMPDLSGILRGQRAGLTRVGASMLGVDLTMVLVAAGLAVTTAVLFGLMPAWQAARRDLTSAIKPGGGGSVSGGFRGLTVRNVLVVSELALALVMLVSAGLMVKSLLRLRETDLGFRPDGVVTFRLALPDSAYPPERRVPFVEQFLARLKARPEVAAAAFGHCAPISDGCNGTIALFPDRPPVARGSEPQVGVTFASPEYFSTMGIRLVRGRWFTDRDRVGQPKVVVINETAARRFWKGEEAVGRRMGLSQGGFRDGAEVIGVVGDVRYRSVESAAGPDAYIPVLQSPRPLGMFFVRSRVSASTLVPVIRDELAAIDRDLPISDIKTMDERYGEATWRTWMIGSLLALFAGLALILALVGIFGVLTQGVAQRAREIGVRMALGAERRDILRLVLGRASVMAAAGVAAGLAGSYFASRLLTTLLYEVEPNDVAVLSSVALLLFAVSLLASYLPARRATRVDPLETLRSE